MALFKRVHLQLVLQGKKSQTRRTHKHQWKVGKAYGIHDRWFTKPQGKILILRRFRQCLGEISQEDAQKEGYNTIEDYKKAWTEIYGQWTPERVITVYEFKLVETNKDRPSPAAENHKP